METINLKIDSLSYGGNGVGRHEGIVYFVPFSAPGDLLEVQITQKEKRYRYADIIRIIEPSPERVTPPCPHAGSCGGCQWQHINYVTQTESKTGELKTALLKLRLNEAAEKINTIIASPKQFGYRRTARFKTEPSDGKESLDFGFYRSGSRDLIKISNCMLLEQQINEFLPQLRLNDNNLVGFDLFMDEEKEVHPFYRFSEKDPGADFFQVNSEVNRLLIDYINKIIRGKTSERKPRIMDLYCGDGNLSLPFADIAASIAAWDNSKTAIDRGRIKAENAMNRNPGCKIKFFNADVSRSWKNISGYARNTDCIIIDPPRRGLKNQTARLAGLKVPIIVYISCSPPALVRDLADLEKAGYTVQELQPFDMFPQTYHLETVTVLVKK